MRTRIAQQVLKPGGAGGVGAEFRALQKSQLLSKYEFIPIVLENCHPGVNWRDIQFYREAFRSVKPDLIHIRGLGPDGLNAIIGARLAGCSDVLVAVHGLYSDLVYINPVKRFISRFMVEDLSMFLAKGISCVCENASKRDRFNCFKKKMLPFVYNRAPDYSNYDRSAIRLETRNQLGIPEDNLVGLYVGRMTKEKGIDYLLKALADMDNEWPSDFTFIYVGAGDQLESMIDKSKELAHSDSVLFLGEQSDVYKYLFCADFFCMPSLHENHSIALLEALAAGLPMISTDVGGNPEIVSDDGRGVLVPPADSRALQNAIMNWLNNRDKLLAAKRMSENACLADFSDESVDERLDALYRTMLSAK